MAENTDAGGASREVVQVRVYEVDRERAHSEKRVNETWPEVMNRLLNEALGETADGLAARGE